LNTQNTFDGGAKSPSKLSHIVLKTSRFREMVDWYLAVLNGRVVHGNDRIAFITYDEEHHRIAIVRMDDLDPRPAYAAGLDHVSFTYADLADLLTTYKRLRDIEIKPRWPVNHGITTSFYYQDPDGNKVELQFENYPTAEEVVAYMEGPEFAANPLGSAFDPEQLIARFESGEPVYALVHDNRDPQSPRPTQILSEMGLFRP
jgi:catechol 2,3-dioxygenase-like lactoylglutathione lyase family enzyme